jgi:hypothetical protein
MHNESSAVQMPDSSAYTFSGSLRSQKLSAELDAWIHFDLGGTGILDPFHHDHDVSSFVTWHCQKHAHVESDESLTTFGVSDSARVAWLDDSMMGANAGSKSSTHHTAVDSFADRGHVLDHDGGVELLTLMSSHVHADTSDRQRPGRSTPKSRPPAHATTPFVRKITCSMSLRMLNIPRAMQGHLSLCHTYHMIGHRRSRQCTVQIHSPDGFQHPVRMVAATGSHHHRLTEGWRAFCKHAGVQVGDAIHFHRTGVPGVLNASIDRRVAQAGDG